MCSASHTADVETIIQLVRNFVQSVPSDGNYGSCDSRKWILDWVIPCEIVCEIHVAQLLQTLSSLTAEHTNSNSSVVEKPFSKLVAPSGDAQERQSAGSFETKLRMFFY
jgi:hypothetical protein